MFWSGRRVLRVERSGTRSLKTSGLVFLFEQDAGAVDGVAAELVVASKFQFIEAAMTLNHSEAFAGLDC